MSERWLAELKLVEAPYGPVEKAPDLAWFIVPHWTLRNGWNKVQTQLLVFIPPGYPATPPDNFYADGDLLLASGSKPGSADLEAQIGKSWLRFSYHVEAGDWKPHAVPTDGHNLLTFLAGVAKRLEEVS